ncbi:MAG: argininosuccinate lyase [Thermoanaerobaculia bacterium]
MKRNAAGRKPGRARRALWGGGFREAPGKATSRLSVSHPFDRALAPHDIRGSVAHARGLWKAGLLSGRALARLERALRTIAAEIGSGRFRFTDRDEDVHLNVERRQIELTGEDGAAIHAGRSRNDQVALDLRLWTAEAIDAARGTLRGLGLALLDGADRLLDAGVVVAARTHMRPAQPILLAHAFHAYAEMLVRDRQRFAQARERTAVSPLGSGACAGTTLPLDRMAAARELGWAAISGNSLDAVSDRDFVVEFIGAAAIAMVHLSSLAEDLILWSGEEQPVLTLAEATTTGSSMMPQKRNPDPLELVRGKTGRVAGHLLGTVVTLKGLPLAYNRDLQETQEPLYDAAETLMRSLAAVTEVVRGVEPVAKSRRPAIDPSALATDIAEELVRRGVPFRRAHERVAAWCAASRAAGRDLREVSGEKDPRLRPFLEKLTPESAVARRDLPGGTAPRRVRAALARTRNELSRS